MKVIPGTRQADLFGFQSIYKIGMPDEGYSRNASSGLVKRTCLAFKVFISMPDEGYSRNASSGLVWLSKYL